jgi:hypothetical protein
VLAAEANGRNDDGRSLSLGANLTTRWLPGKRLTIRATTWDWYRRKVERPSCLTIGRRTFWDPRTVLVVGAGPIGPSPR